MVGNNYLAGAISSSVSMRLVCCGFGLPNKINYKYLKLSRNFFLSKLYQTIKI